MALIVNQQGNPEPPSEVSRRLRGVHPGLSLRYVETAPPSWGICMEWDETDRRRELVQSGELAPGATHDIVGYLPLGCSVDEAPAYLERSLRAYPKEEIASLVDRVNNYNSYTPVREAVESAIAEVADKPMAEKSKIISVPKKKGSRSKYL